MVTAKLSPGQPSSARPNSRLTAVPGLALTAGSAP